MEVIHDVVTIFKKPVRLDLCLLTWDFNQLVVAIRKQINFDYEDRTILFRKAVVFNQHSSDPTIQMWRHELRRIISDNVFKIFCSLSFLFFDRSGTFHDLLPLKFEQAVC